MKKITCLYQFFGAELSEMYCTKFLMGAWIPLTAISQFISKFSVGNRAWSMFNSEFVTFKQVSSNTCRVKYVRQVLWCALVAWQRREERNLIRIFAIYYNLPLSRPGARLSHITRTAFVAWKNPHLRLKLVY